MSKYIPNFEELDKLVVSGYIAKKISSCGKYKLFNYTEKTVYEKLWNEHTLNSRGHIYEIATGKSVNCPFGKFMNLSELSSEKQAHILSQNNFNVFTKEDGSCGILSYYDNDWRFSTRGSFNSDQAIKAKEMLSKYNIDNLFKNTTYILEIIYPENRIVVDYGKTEELVLLAMYVTESGIERSLLNHSVFPVSKSHNFASIQEVIDYTSGLSANEEGFVVRLSNGERFKLKSPEYLKIARILTRMSPLVLWESMKGGLVSKELMESIPEEFRVDYERFQETLERTYKETREAIRIHYNEVLSELGIQTKEDMPDDVSKLRKHLGIYIQKNPNELNSVLFGVLLCKQDQINDFIMKRIRPTGNTINEVL